MPYRRTSSLFAAATTAATATTTAVLSAAVSVVSAATALALAAPAASAAPIPLPHYRTVDGITGAGHHAPAGRQGGLPGGADHHAVDGDQRRPAGHPASADRRSPAGHHISAGGRHRPSDHGLPVDRLIPADRPTPTGHRAPGDKDTPALNPAAPSAPAPASVDHLTVTVRGSGSARTDGTFELYCHPARGNHPHAKKACTKLDGMTRWGRDPFAPVPQGANCTMIYGGPATAHITGTWAGRPVNADFRRTNGCEISRWSSFEPLLPSTSS
ncbi:subtilase-type protease inhibitor [Streptomyces platensis]|uniref:Subtilase-type protease inhibitor n=1 Tax=Streptomyces platensis TaxID=58346 RepID=A0ABX3Y0K0_STRPT|nr:SSI family serine proteinase inhibitor [Streptomyces platensis]OSY45815.1 subtilase-type protease inhibitor [Streptomyces platensis]